MLFYVIVYLGNFSCWWYGRGGGGGGGIKKKSFSFLNFTCRQLSKYELTMKLNSDQQFHQYQQSKQSPLILTRWTQKRPWHMTGNPGLGQAQKCKWDRRVSYCRVFNNEGPGQTKSASMLFTCERRTSTLIGRIDQSNRT